MNLDWKSEKKILFISADAPPHGKIYYNLSEIKKLNVAKNFNYEDFDHFPDEVGIEETLKKLEEKNI